MRRLAGIFGFLFLLNLIIYVAVTLRIGGDAINGGFINGHYFLSDHGKLTEVDRGTFLYSQWHTWILCANMGLFFVFAIPVVFAEKRRKRSAQ